MMQTTKRRNMEQIWLDCVVQNSAIYGARIDDKGKERLKTYAEMLVAWNEKINLTTILDDEGIAVKHFIDSFTILPQLKKGARLIDVGTGAGFPGIPLAIVRPDIQVTLVDSLRKKVDFLEEVIKELALTNIRAFHSRAEDFARLPKHREKYDVAVARAVALLPALLEYCLPFVKVGGQFIAMKGPDGANELSSAGKALSILGGTCEGTKTFTLPGTDMQRCLISVQKVQETPRNYPRKSGKPGKEPLI